MTAAESFFLRAEGALRGWDMGGTAKSFYEQGVRMSFEENNAAGVDDYLADHTSTPGAFADNVGSDNYTFSSRVTPAWDDNAGFEAQLERIITQKWIANYPDGPEGWSEYRRTGYPEVIPVVRNSSNGTIDTQLQVRRLPYTRDEKINNASLALPVVYRLWVVRIRVELNSGGTKIPITGEWTLFNSKNTNYDENKNNRFTDFPYRNILFL